MKRASLIWVFNVVFKKNRMSFRYSECQIILRNLFSGYKQYTFFTVYHLPLQGICPSDARGFENIYPARGPFHSPTGRRTGLIIAGSGRRLSPTGTLRLWKPVERVTKSGRVAAAAAAAAFGNDRPPPPMSVAFTGRPLSVVRRHCRGRVLSCPSPFVAHVYCAIAVDFPP